MIRITVTPRNHQDLYSLLTQKERALRKRNQGTLHRFGGKKREVKWVHKSYSGWIRFQKSLGGTIVAIVQSRRDGDDWQLLTSFVGFLDRHFRNQISTINIGYQT